MIYLQIEFVCKRLISLELIKYIVKTDRHLFFNYISPLCDLDLEDSILITSHDFLVESWLIVHHWHTKFGYKRLPKNPAQPTQVQTGNKYLSRALQPSPLKTLKWFPFCREINDAPHWHSVKRGQTELLPPVSWCGFIPVSGSEVNGTNGNSSFVCSHLTPF